MLNIIVISIVILNIFSIFILFNMLRGTDIKFRLMFVLVLIFIMLILVNVILTIGQVGITSEWLTESLKPFIMFIMLPINIILIASPIAIQVNKVKSGYIEKEKFLRNLFICLLIDAILIVLECVYVKNISLEIIKMTMKNL